MGFLDNNGLRQLWSKILSKLSERVDWDSFNTLVGDTSVSDQIDDAVSNKIDKENPTGTGSFSLNRRSSTTIGDYSFAEGYLNIASGNYSHAEGNYTKASGEVSHAEGRETIASGRRSHAEGSSTTASGDYSHAEGSVTTASGRHSHAEGNNTTASGDYSHAEGFGTHASSENQHVQGKSNIEDTTNTYADIIGNGADVSHRSNAATVDWSGNAWYAGDVYVGSSSGTNKDEGSKKLATEEYVTSKIASGIKLSDKINGYRYIVEMENGHLVSSCCATRIQVVTLPDTLSYAEGATLDMTGMIVQAWCEDGTTKIIDNAKCTWSGSMTAEDTTITIFYKEGETLFQDIFDVEITTS